MINLKHENWEIKNIETVLFDKDGTFIDLHFFWGKMTEMRALEVIKRYSLPLEYFEKICLFLGFDKILGKMLEDGITALYSRNQIIELFKNDLIKLGVDATTRELEEIFDSVSEEFYKKINDYTKPIDDAISFIKELKIHGVKTGIVTSDSLVSTKLTIKNFGWEDLFDSVIGRESSKETKESGIPTQMALEELCADPNTTVMIGDAPMDYVSAKNAKIDNIILVSTGQINKKELMKTSKYVLDSLSELKIYV